MGETVQTQVRSIEQSQRTEAVVNTGTVQSTQTQTVTSTSPATTPQTEQPSGATTPATAPPDEMGKILTDLLMDVNDLLLELATCSCPNAQNCPVAQAARNVCRRFKELVQLMRARRR